MGSLRGRAVHFLFVATLAFWAQSAHTELRILMAYELFSWKVSDGSWSFYVRPNTNSEADVEEVFRDRARLRTIEALKSRLAKLPPGATIYWLTRIPLDVSRPRAAGSEALGFPPGQH
jgi:hypothetical protein